MRFFRNPFRRKARFPQASKYIIKPAFEVGGIQYYQFDDLFNLPFERGMMALAYFEECRMGVSREYLQLHAGEVEKLLHADKIDIFKINTLNQQLVERMTFFTDAELLYKLASIVYFDHNENPAYYEPEHCARKIAAWKKEKECLDFFLQQQLRELIPFLNIADNDLEASLRLAEQVREMQQASAFHL